MLKYIGKRLIMLIPVILVTSFLIFWAMSLTGGDPALMLAGDNAKPEQIEQIREDLGLNDPFIVRYGNYPCRSVFTLRYIKIHGRIQRV